MSFEELIEEGKESYARGTINKYLGEEYEKGHVNREGRRGKYFLSMKGKQWLFDFSSTTLENANNQWLETTIKLAQEGHARILTKKELEEEAKHWQDASKLPVEIDDEGLHSLGITEGQIMVIDIFKELDKKWKKEGIIIVNRVQGKKGFYKVERK